LLKLDNLNTFYTAVFDKPLKLKSRVVLAGHTIAIATYCVSKLITYSPVIEQFLDTMIVHLTAGSRFEPPFNDDFLL